MGLRSQTFKKIQPTPLSINYIVIGFKVTHHFLYLKVSVLEDTNRGNENVKSSVLFNHSGNNEKIAINKELGRILENAIHEIPENYRIVFSLREINGLSVAETAEALNISESNVKVRLNRAKVMLQREIKKMYLTEDIKI